MHDLFSILDYNSVLSSIQAASDQSTAGLQILSTVAPHPKDAVGLGSAALGAHRAVRCALDFLCEPSQSALEQGELLHAFFKHVRSQLSNSLTAEVLSHRGRSLTNFPGWKLFVHLGSKEMPIAAQISAGLWLLFSALKETNIPRAAAKNILKFGQSCALSAEQLRKLLDSDVDALDTEWPWLAPLKKKWPGMRNVLLENAAPPPPSPSFNMRARSQIGGKAVYPSPSHQAGTPNHRNVSKGQFRNACDQVALWTRADDWRGTWAVCSALTSLTIDLLPEVPLAEHVDESWVTCIDIAAGTIRTDITFLAEDAASAPANGTALTAALIIERLPASLASNLRSRLTEHPHSRSLKDLYPEAYPLLGEQAMIADCGEIVCSWARWGSSLGLYARALCIDNLVVALITSDLGHIPRSKIHYAAVDPKEIWLASRLCFDHFGWGDVEPYFGTSVSFGSRAVPTDTALRQAAAQHISEVEAMRPARSDKDICKLLEFHNRYTRYVGFEIALLLAFRQSKAYQIYADVDEDFDAWIAVLDKHVPGPQGGLPVPLCNRAKRLIKMYRSHCMAMYGRLERCGKGSFSFCKWLLAVIRHEHVPLLSTSRDLEQVASVSSQSVFRSVGPSFALAADCGRKWFENSLRKEGMRTGDIDAVLRHDIVGQSRASSSSDFTLLEWTQRVAVAIDRVADGVLPQVHHGLARR